ncbi:hypothetical protein BU16DRAFT_88451 [Lophium mytilinum]|uniref:BTB domain-containing protein n=1 Tax=Lophium mytilinum TaxID=390894 RepID=A0A6A6QKR1_9PEZI|nr:hypothetical protein BU16DRAFT_88451 [Lophium mytilinum]
MSERPTLELMTALSNLLEFGKYSDLKIACGMRSYPVHRAIICSRSSFFDGACSNPFREAETGIIDLSEDDPEAVEHMVNYFYHLDYLNSLRPRRASQRSSRPASPASPQRAAGIVRRRSKKLSLAKLEDPLLATAAANTVTPPLTPIEDAPVDHFEDVDAKLPDTPMQDQLDEEDLFEAAFAEPAVDSDAPHLVTHAKVYAIAEKYGVFGLKSLAAQKFAASLAAGHHASPEFPDACGDVYETTVDSDRGLRDLVIATFRANPALNLRKDVEGVVRETPGLAWELYRVACGLPVYSS